MVSKCPLQGAKRTSGGKNGKQMSFTGCQKDKWGQKEEAVVLYKVPKEQE